MNADWNSKNVPEWAKWVASNYHFRDLTHFADGSFGSVRITHNQFVRELEEAFERGRIGNKSCWQEKREDWRKPQEQTK